MKYDVSSIKEYLEVIPEERKPVIKKIMAIIRKQAPKIKEEYSHNMPFYTILGEPLFAVASQKHFMALYIADSELCIQYQSALGKVSMGKSCIRFKKEEHLDWEVVGELIKEAYQKKFKG